MSEKEKEMEQEVPAEEMESEEISEEIIEEDASAEDATEEEAGESLEAKIKALEEAAAADKDKYLRLLAEYDNFRKRSAREKDALRAEIITNVTSKFLPVMDNLERALNAECSDENYKNGVRMINDSFMETLGGLGVEEIKSDGAVFDPSYHQAVQRVAEGDAESGTVVQTFAKGYKIGEKVIRFAMVAVKE